MADLDDLSGPFNPDLKFADLSKDFLLKIMDVWQFAWIHMAQAFYIATSKRHGIDEANEIQLEVWTTLGEKVNPRYPEIANIEMKTVLDSLKAAQLATDSTMGDLYRLQYDIKDENHVIITIPNCRSLQFYEKHAPEMINFFCHVLEEQVMRKYYINPKVSVTPLKVPPRESPDEVSCQWELKLED